jgi:glycosyltransferase involved in cell wall biosynthesis
MLNINIVKKVDRFKLACMEFYFKYSFDSFKIGQTYKQNIFHEKTMLMNPDADLDIRNIYEISKDKYIIMYYGSIEKGQGIETLLDAYINLKAEVDSIALIICGNGSYSEKLETYVKENNVDDVRFIIEREPEKRHIYLSQSDVMVFPSASKAKKRSKFTLTIGEAARYCKPIIASSEIDRVKDMIIDGENGFLVDEGSVDALHATIGTIVTNKILLKRMREAGGNKPQPYQFTAVSNQVNPKSSTFRVRPLIHNQNI